MPAVPGPDGLKLISTLGRPEWVLIAEIAIAVFSHMQQLPLPLPPTQQPHYWPPQGRRLQSLHQQQALRTSYQTIGLPSSGVIVSRLGKLAPLDCLR